jgi:uncharacterized protein YecE (DUF72 family)
MSSRQQVNARVLTEARTPADWKNRAPSGFTFATKASRFPHAHEELKAPDEPLDRLLSRSSGLGRMLGPILYRFG